MIQVDKRFLAKAFIGVDEQLASPESKWIWSLENEPKLTRGG